MRKQETQAKIKEAARIIKGAATSPPSPEQVSQRKAAFHLSGAKTGCGANTTRGCSSWDTFTNTRRKFGLY